MKKSIIIIISILLILPVVVNAESKYLYDVLKDEAESGGLAREYTGEHQDTVDNSGTDKIYHYYSTSDSDATNIINKNNVIFAGMCWGMFRTTDSGGVKLLFKGYPINDSCPNYPNTSISSTFTNYENILKIGGVGYMYNKLYPGPEYFTPQYGSYTQDGNSIEQTSYTIINNSLSGSFTFSDQKEWQSAMVNYYAKSGEISFKVNESGNYLFSFNYIEKASIDKVIIKINDIEINRINVTLSGNIPLNNLSSSDIIKVIFQASSTATSSLKFSIKTPTGSVTDTRMYFGNDVNYTNGLYTLIDTIRSDSTYDLSQHHYFCRDGSLSCSEVYYEISYGSSILYTYKLTNGQKIKDFIDDQLYADDVNQYDSPLKETIENWFEGNLINYQKYLEDTVFCSKRTLAEELLNPFNPNGLSPWGTNDNSYFHKIEYNAPDPEAAILYNKNLKCKNETDRFSVSNPIAKIKYSVATINLAEALLLANTYDSYNGGKVRSYTGNKYSYWLLNPYSIGGNNYAWGVSYDGQMAYRYAAENANVLPVISLKKGIEIKSGDGSVSNPYIIKEYHNINIEIINETEDITVSINNLNQSYDNEPVNFKITPIKGYKVKNVRIVDEDNNEIDYTTTDNKNYIFIMPSSNVTIIPSYERVKSAVNVEDNKNTKEFVIEVNDATAVVYEDTVRFRLQPEEGYEVEDIDIIDEEHNKISYRKTSNINEYEFTMPDTNVIIKPKYRKIDSSELINPNTKSQIIFVIISLIILGIITSVYSKKKRFNT